MGASFAEQLRDEARPVWDAIFAHPFFQELTTGSLPVEKFRYYISQDYLYLEAFGRAVALALGRAPDSATVRLLAARVLTPIERPLHARLFELTGLDEALVQSIEPAPSNRAYMDHLLATAGLRSLGETVAALLPCPWTYDEIGKRLAALPPPSDRVYREWAGFYSAGFLQESVRAWRELLELAAAEASPSERVAMRDAFLISSRHEFAFWTMAHRMEQWPG